MKTSEEMSLGSARLQQRKNRPGAQMSKEGKRCDVSETRRITRSWGTGGGAQ